MGGLDGLRIARGVPPGSEGAVTALFWDAFSGKLGRILGPASKALPYLTEVVQSHNALCAWDGAGRLVGLAGLKTRAGGLIGGEFADLAAVYGWGGALWRGPLLEMTDRVLLEGQMSVDGICVARDLRGRGIGSALLDGAVDHGRELGLDQLWLEVVEENPRARALYLRSGFRPAGVRRMGVFAPLFGVRRVEAMVLDL